MLLFPVTLKTHLSSHPMFEGLHRNLKSKQPDSYCAKSRLCPAVLLLPLFLELFQSQDTSSSYTLLKVKVKSLSRVRLFATLWTVAYQAPLSIEFSRHQDQSGLPFPSPGDFPDPGIEPGSPTLQADALPPEPPGKPIHYWNTKLVHFL